jgi:hypothetical protein
MRAEIQKLSARVLRDLYDYCGSRGIQSIAVTCNHTLRQTVIPVGATEEERTELLSRAQPMPARLYRVSLDHPHAQTVVNWREASLARVNQLSTVEYDGLTSLVLTTDAAQSSDAHDAAGELQF